ncbi:MAG: DEAD/DEAH box helicase family protein [Cyclobacteriaceae bacterium]|tara:strand:+ start:10594 stop:14019 length:3426 start_codon:yes stop_codon:yes gene_type:complete
MSNFAFLDNTLQGVKDQATAAEQYVRSDPRVSVFYSRLALEHAVYWLYNHDDSLPSLAELCSYNGGRFLSLDELMNEAAFEDLINDHDLYQSLFQIKLIGNKAAHRNRESISQKAALSAVEQLYGFLLQLAANYQDEVPHVRPFDIGHIPTAVPAISQKEQQRLQEEISSERKELQELRLQLAEEKAAFEAERAAFRAKREDKGDEAKIKSEDWTESDTRTRLIDVLLREAGWDLAAEDVQEFKITGLPKPAFPEGWGKADYVLWDNDHRPLAVIEAKKTIKSPEVGKHQGKLYADGLERLYDQRPIIYYSNGFSTWCWEDRFYPERKVMGFHTKAELQWMLQRNQTRKHPLSVEPNRSIVGGQGRTYQLHAINRTMKRFCDKDRLIGTHRKGLLVMATGSGKTRTAAGIIEVLAKANWIKRTLFLADRTALVDQAKKAIAEYLPAFSCRDITREEDDLATRIVFSTYQTIINRIETADRNYTIGHFDLIIVDEAHRSIYNKYGQIFDYFDSLVLGLTATPRDEVDFDTYEFFGHGREEPIYNYDLSEAAEDHHLLLPKGKQVDLGFVRRGIKFDELSEEEQQKYQETFANPDGSYPTEIDPQAINQWLYNKDTIRKVLEELMTHGIKVSDQVGKTIVFARNKEHAELISSIFTEQYPAYGGAFCQTIHHETEKSGDLIDNFKVPDKMPRVAVSVDMLDTGIDVPEIVNLVFFKPVYSKSKYWQMVGRGTRKCEDLFGPGLDKKTFYIFDFCGNFDFFKENPEGIPGATPDSLSRLIFLQMLQIVFHLSKPPHDNDEDLQLYREELTDRLYGQYAKLLQLQDNVSVRRELETVLKYQDRETWNDLDQEKHWPDLANKISPLIDLNDPDEYAKRFDYLLYKIQLAQLTKDLGLDTLVSRVRNTAQSLFKKAKPNLPEVYSKIETIRKCMLTDFWKNSSIIHVDEVRLELRNIIRLLDKEKKKIYHTNFEDHVDQRLEVADPIGVFGGKMTNYHERLESLLSAHKDHMAINKIRKLQKITDAELNSLIEIFLQDVEEDDRAGFQEYLTGHSLNLLIRTMMGLDPQAVKEAFVEIERTYRLSDIQIRFLQEIVNSVSQRGILELGDLYTGRQFKSIHDGGIDAVFEEDVVDKVFDILKKINQTA